MELSAGSPEQDRIAGGGYSQREGRREEPEAERDPNGKADRSVASQRPEGNDRIPSAERTKIEEAPDLEEGGQIDNHDACGPSDRRARHPVARDEDEVESDVHRKR